MHTYIYATNKGIVFVGAGDTKQIAERQALDFIQQMVKEEGMPSSVSDNRLLTSVNEVLKTENVEQAIKAWDCYAKIVLKQHVSCHKLHQADIVE